MSEYEAYGHSLIQMIGTPQLVVQIASGARTPNAPHVWFLDICYSFSTDNLKLIHLASRHHANVAPHLSSDQLVHHD
jgi:hypothetical protein